MYRFGRLFLVLQLLIIHGSINGKFFSLSVDLLLVPEYLLSSLLAVVLFGIFLWRLTVFFKNVWRKTRVEPTDSNNTSKILPQEVSISLDHTLQPFAKTAQEKPKKLKANQFCKSHDAGTFYIIGLWMIPIILLDIIISQTSKELKLNQSRGPAPFLSLLFLGAFLLIWSILGNALKQSTR